MGLDGIDGTSACAADTHSHGTTGSSCRSGYHKCVYRLIGFSRLSERTFSIDSGVCYICQDFSRCFLKVDQVPEVGIAEILPADSGTAHKLPGICICIIGGSEINRGLSSGSYIPVNGCLFTATRVASFNVDPIAFGK